MKKIRVKTQLILWYACRSVRVRTVELQVYGNAKGNARCNKPVSQSVSQFKVFFVAKESRMWIEDGK